MKTVLHIAAHMGGGVGKVLSNVAINNDSKYQHHIVLLEKPIDTVFTDKLDDEYLTIAPSINIIGDLIRDADIVQLDWWGHPLMAGVMHQIRDMNMRLVVWAHTAGCYYPFIRADFVTLPHQFIFSTRYSMENPYWSSREVRAMTNTSVVNSSGGFAPTRYVPLEPHNGFTVGYVGTLAYIKLLPQFIEYCKEVSDIPGVKFVMIGRIPEPNLVLEDAEKAGIADKFVFKGYVKNLSAELAQLDVLGYLLNPYHFGTTENAMLEAMSMGIPPVCMYQCAEKYLIKHGVTGYLIRNKTEYRNTITNLYAHKDIRFAVGLKARDHVLAHLELSNTIGRLNTVYTKVLSEKKQCFDFDMVFGKYTKNWYNSMKPPGDISNLSVYLNDASKGSIRQWQKYYPGEL